MKRLQWTALCFASTLFGLGAYAAEPKTEKIEVSLNIPANPFIDQLCIVFNYVSMAAIICMLIFGGIWLVKKKDAPLEDDETESSTSTPKPEIKTETSAPAKSEAKTAIVPEVNVEEITKVEKVEEIPKTEETAEPEVEAKTEAKAEPTESKSKAKTKSPANPKEEKTAPETSKQADATTTKKPKRSKKKD